MIMRLIPFLPLKQVYVDPCFLNVFWPPMFGPSPSPLWQDTSEVMAVYQQAEKEARPGPKRDAPYRMGPIDVPNSHWLVDEKRGGWRNPFNNRQMMIDGIPNRPLYFYQKDIIDGAPQL